MEKQKLIVGVVGKVGSGKSAVASILSEKYHFRHIDADLFGHLALEKEKEHLFKSFGDAIKNPDGGIDRKKLGEIVFSNPDQLLLLNSLVHPRIKKEISGFIQASSDERFVIDAALLFEIGLHELCDFIITVEAPEDIILERVKKYRDWSEEKTRNVIRSQEYLAFLREKTHYIIFNNGDWKKLEKQVEFFIHILF